MNKASIKPRWKDWENKCIKLAFEKKIQHKVISVALDKTVTAINKKIKKLGLRDPFSKPGRIKGQKCSLKIEQRISRDILEMSKIMESFCPNPNRQSIPKMSKRNAKFSQTASFHYILTKPDQPNQTRIERIAGYPFYVPYEHVEQWAISEGYCRVENNLQKVGLCLWKDGRYFSRAQVLMCVNGLRKEKNLKPLFYEEENKENGNDLKTTQIHPSQYRMKEPCDIVHYKK